MKRLILMAFGAGLFFTSCNKEDSADVNQDKIYCDYELFYNQNEDKTHAVARFRFGGATGTLLELTDSTSANVMYNGEVLPYNVWYGGHHKEFAGRVEGGTFTYTNVEGTVFNNDVPTGDTIAFPADFDTIKKSVAESLIWGGSALAADQHVGLFVGSWSWGDDALFFQSALGATEIVMGVTQKEELELGTSVVYMDRSTAMDIAEGTSEGGRIRYRYRCENAVVTVVE